MSDLDEFDQVKQHLNVREEPEGTVYTPPDGKPVNSEGIYLPDDPSTLTDRLINTERRYILPIAQVVARIFHVLPITDDVYRTVPMDLRDKLLNVIVSRSDIRQISSNIIGWPAIRVVVKQYEVVRIHVLRDFSKDTCDVTEMQLWVNLMNGYHLIRDPHGPIGPEALSAILTRYGDKEGILPAALVPAIR